MVLDTIPQPLPVHFFGSRPQPPTSPDDHFESHLPRRYTLCVLLCNVLQHVAACCSMLQFVALYGWHIYVISSIRGVFWERKKLISYNLQGQQVLRNCECTAEFEIKLMKYDPQTQRSCDERCTLTFVQFFFLRDGKDGKRKRAEGDLYVYICRMYRYRYV